MKTYRAFVTCQDGWLIIRVPELGLITQARHEGEIETTARDVIALELDVDIREVQVHLEQADEVSVEDDLRN